MNLEKQFAKSMAHFVSIDEWKGYKSGVQDVCSAAQPLLDDMLEALEKISDIEPDPDNMGRFHEIAIAAITKARGDSQ